MTSAQSGTLRSWRATTGCRRTTGRAEALPIADFMYEAKGRVKWTHPSYPYCNSFQTFACKIAQV